MLPTKSTFAPSPALQGALWMLVSVALSAANLVFVRMATEEVHPFVAVFFRNFLGLLLLLPWTVTRGGWRLPGRTLPLYGLRAMCSVVSMFAFFYAITVTPMAEATALYLTMPLFAVLGAALLLSERVSVGRRIGVLVGFGGALLIIRPGVDGALSLGALAALAAAVFGAGDWLALKPLARTDSMRVILSWFTLLTTPLALAAALFVWQTPSLETLGWLAALAATSTIGQFAATRATAASDLSYLALFDFLRVVFVAAAGYMVFAEVLSAWSAAGAAIIVLASAHSAGHEMRARRRAEKGTAG